MIYDVALYKSNLTRLLNILIPRHILSMRKGAIGSLINYVFIALYHTCFGFLIFRLLLRSPNRRKSDNNSAARPRRKTQQKRSYRFLLMSLHRPAVYYDFKVFTHYCAFKALQGLAPGSISKLPRPFRPVSRVKVCN